MEIVQPSLDEYSRLHSTKVDKTFEALRKETYAATSHPEMQVGPLEGRFLRMLVLMTGARTVLEFGTFTGYSALMMASALPEDGVLYTLDRDEVTNKIARKYFDKAQFGKKIRPILGNAKETIKTISGPIDLAFIDADKTAYDFYYEEALKRLRPGGIIVMDNMLWEGEVLSPEDDDGKAIDALNNKIAKDPRVEAVLLTVRDGIMLVRKK
jgi:caffeoyl-CoA O-methyltransferase